LLTPAPAPAITDSDDEEADEAAAIAAAVQAAMAARRKQAIDPAAVRAIVAEELGKLTLPRPLAVTVTTPTATIKTGGNRHEAFEDVLRAISKGLGVYLVGPAGSGKTTLAGQCAEALGLDFYFTGAIDSSYKLSGFTDAHGRVVPTEFKRAYEKGGLFLFDEVDASDAGALLAFNAALANGHADFPEGAIKRHPDFRVIAAANTYGTGASRVYVGRNQLDAATLDRFVFLTMGYDSKLEATLAPAEIVQRIQSIRAAVDRLKIRHIVSPRASIQLAALLDAGMSRAAAEDAAIWKGLDTDTRHKIEQEAH
jgi:MoxR-like ATPase